MSKILQANLEAALATTGEGGFGDGDDDGSSVDTEIQQIQIIKDVPKTKKKNQKKKKDDIVASGLSNVIYIGHIPVGFEEHEMRGFFNQFGNVENVRLSRSKRTGNSKGYGFVQFSSPQVAKIASDAMSGYFLLEKRLVCHIIPTEKVHENLFPKKPFRKANFRVNNQKSVNRKRSSSEWEAMTKQQAAREKKKIEKLKKLGIDYEFPVCTETKSAGSKPNVNKRKVSEDDVDVVSKGSKTPKKDPPVSAKKTTKKPKVTQQDTASSSPLTGTKLSKKEAEPGKKIKKTPRKSLSEPTNNLVANTPSPAATSSRKKLRSSKKATVKK